MIQKEIPKLSGHVFYYRRSDNAVFFTTVFGKDENEVSLLSEEAIDRAASGDMGWHGFWGTYNGKNQFDACKLDFLAYVNYRMQTNLTGFSKEISIDSLPEEVSR